MPFNHLYILLKLFPYKPWDLRYLSKNPNITWDFIKHIYDMEYADFWYNTKPGNNFNTEYYHKLRKKYKYLDKLDWVEISRNPNITWDNIVNNSLYPWCIQSINQNPNINWDIVVNNPDKSWDWLGISFNPNINRSKDNFNITLDNVGNNLLSWYLLSENITWDIIINNSDKPWMWSGISRNKNITWDIVMNNPDKPWDWLGISYNPNITWYIIVNNPDKPWDWLGISCNPNITWDIVVNNPDKLWDWRGISLNPNITWDIVVNNPDKLWDWINLSQNKFNRVNATITIQRWWKKWKKYLYKRNHKKIYKHVMTELIYKPGLGTEYYKSLEEFNSFI